MTGRRRTPSSRGVRRAAEQTSVRSHLDSLTDRRLPGGCDDCTAYQTVERHSSGVYLLNVHHDETCPTSRAMRPRRTP